MNTTLPDYIVARLRRPYPKGAPVVPGSTPVLSFGNVSEATVATLGLNPSRQEFLNPKGCELSGEERRFETLSSLGVPSLESATEAELHRVVNACNNYFRGKPYHRWFDQLEPVLKSVGASYYDGTACHIDLVQWATDPVWGKIKNRDVRAKLIEEDAPFLCNQLKVGSFKLLLINGRGVMQQFERMTGIKLRWAGVVKGTSAASDMSVGELPNGTRVVAWSVNVQSSRGVCSELRAALASRVGELAS
jgi:hypothetical protein